MLDGRNRLDAMELVGIPTVNKKGELLLCLVDQGCLVMDIDPWTFVISANAHRRHLTDEQKREIIAAVLKAQPEKSDRAIAAELGVGRMKVNRARKATVTGVTVDKRIGLDGKARKQPAKKDLFDRGKGCDFDSTSQAKDDAEPYRVTRARGYFASVKEAVRLAHENLFIVENKAEWARLDPDEITSEVIEAAEGAAAAWSECVQKLRAVQRQAHGAAHV